MSEAFKLVIINRHTGFKKINTHKKSIIVNTNYHSRNHIPLSSPPPWTHTHPHPLTYSYPTYIHTPLQSSTRHACTSLHRNTHLNPNQTATQVKPCRMVETVQMADHALLGSWTAVGTKEFPLLLVLCASGASIWTPHTGHAQGALK